MSGNKKIARIIQFLLFAAGIFLCYQFFNSINLNEVKEYISRGKKWPIFLVFLVSILVYVFRVLRWHQLLEAADEQNNNVYASFSALSISYLISFFLPRVGELGRCLLINKYKQVPVAKSIGTVIIERITDILALLMIIATCLLLVNQKITQFFKENIFNPIEVLFQKLSSTNLIVITIVLIVFAILTFKYVLPFLKTKFTKIFIETKEGRRGVSGCFGDGVIPHHPAAPARPAR
ncbi:MAG: flippase-like domain-containing protein, partial [Bacteroidetes bacterium]|nr:flippase-like domain-containing protein [Bacteroidota bacterium]